MSGRERHRLPEHIEGSVELELARAGPRGSSVALAALVRLWPTVVGEAIARNAWPARVARDGTLVVHVSSSAWAQELTQLEETMKERLGEEAPGRLRFVVGPIPEPGPAGPEPASRAPAPPSPDDEREATALADAIEDQELREAVKRAAALSLAASRTPRPDRPF